MQISAAKQQFEEPSYSVISGISNNGKFAGTEM